MLIPAKEVSKRLWIFWQLCRKISSPAFAPYLFLIPILCHNASLQTDVCFCTSQQKRNCIAHTGLFSLHYLCQFWFVLFQNVSSTARLRDFILTEKIFSLIWGGIKFLLLLPHKWKNRLILQYWSLSQYFYARYCEITSCVWNKGFSWIYIQLSNY